VRVAVEEGATSRDTLRARLEGGDGQRCRVELAEISARIVNAKCSVIGVRAPMDLTSLIDPAGRKREALPTSYRPVTFDGVAQKTPVYWRDHLPVDITLPGPAIIEQFDTTLLVPPGDTVTGHANGNLTLHIGASG